MRTKKALLFKNYYGVGVPGVVYVTVAVGRFKTYLPGGGGGTGVVVFVWAVVIMHCLTNDQMLPL